MEIYVPSWQTDRLSLTEIVLIFSLCWFVLNTNTKKRNNSHCQENTFSIFWWFIANGCVSISEIGYFQRNHRLFLDAKMRYRTFYIIKSLYFWNTQNWLPVQEFRFGLLIVVRSDLSTQNLQHKKYCKHLTLIFESHNIAHLEFMIHRKMKYFTNHTKGLQNVQNPTWFTFFAKFQPECYINNAKTNLSKGEIRMTCKL